MSSLQACEATISLTFPYHFDLTVGGAQVALGASTPNVAAAAPATLVIGDGVLASHTWGCMSTDQYLDAYEVCRLGVSRVAEFSRGYLAKERLMTA